MKAIMLMYDSLNRHMLPPYGCDWVHAPNFRRLAERTVTFDNSYVGSMPCMPARRELHTGRCNFLHRSWGPLEPFDDSMPQLLRESGIHSHLESDHYHYWEDGGATYHTRFSTWNAVRGQEGDTWVADLRPDLPIPESLNHRYRDPERLRQDWANRHYMGGEEGLPQPRTMAGGLEFLRRNAKADNWFLQLETFDPHEPYQVPQRFLDLYKDIDTWTGPHYDWPPYDRIGPEDREATRHVQIVNAALISMCDHYLGTVLDAMDELGLWKDTLLIVNTDHGFLLGEHEWCGKCRMPFWNEIAHTPLFVWDPRCGARGARRSSLVQTIDLPATILEYFGVKRPKDMQGRPLRETVANDSPVRKAGLFGVHGGHVNVTDGRYVYMRGPVSAANAPLFEYTHMPTHMRGMFGVKALRTTRLAPPFAFTKGCPVMKIDMSRLQGTWAKAYDFGTLLYDLESDPKQERPLHDVKVEKRMLGHLVRQMKQNDAPREQYRRLGLNA